MGNITDLMTSWEGHTKGDVEDLIKEEFRKDKADIASKIGAVYYDQQTMSHYFFDSEKSKEEWLSSGDESLILAIEPLKFSGKVSQVRVINEMSSTTLYFTTKASKAEITCSFVSQEKGITDAAWTDVPEDFEVSVYVDKGGVGDFFAIKEKELVLSGNTITFDVKNYLATGANRVRVTATGVQSGSSATLTYTVRLTTMYIAPSNFTWYLPFVEGEGYDLGGVNIGGELDKHLIINVKMEDKYFKSYDIPLGTEIWTSKAYTYGGLEFPTAGSGVYNVEMWLDAGGLESEHLSYNIICVSMADKLTARLVSVSDAPKSVYNFSENKLFNYCVYNAAQATTGGIDADEVLNITLDTVINKNKATIKSEDLVNVPTGQPLEYIATIEAEVPEGSTMELSAVVSYGNAQQVIYPIDNSKSYPATSEVYFYLNPAQRSNTQADRENVVNAINSVAYTAEWTNMAWTEGVDGWTVDEDNRKCLRIPAYSKVDIAYQPLANIKTPITMEFVYKVKNASDYNDPIITICDDPTSPTFKGVKITPKNICLHSNNLKDSKVQDFNTVDEEVMDIIITIVPNYKTNYGNLAQIYCNGVKVRSFEFSSIQEWNVLNNIILGNNTADLYVYKMRVYHKGFDKSDAMRNFVNSLPDTASREAMYAYLHKVTDDSYDVDYDTCVKNGYNTMVIEMIGGKDIPSNDKNANIGDLCNLKISIHNLVEGEIDEEMVDLLNGSTDILNQTIEGQGTTAMTYGRWNFRWKLDKTYGKRRITAKKNVASSMHSHKMGATRLFNYLHGRCVGANEADGNVAVLQYPVHGFQKVLAEDGKNYIYRYIGLYTIGADKGDKHTFGYDDARYESTLMHLEGSDHTPASVGFEYPYYKTQYSAKKDVEAMGALDMNNEVVAAWEVGAAGKYETDVESDRQNVQNMLDTEFAPAYNVAYFNSTYIDGVTATLDDMNANTAQWREGEDAQGRPYSYMEFFIDGEYELIYYNRQTSKYEYYANGGKRLNVLTDLGLTTADVKDMTLAEKTEFIKAKRRERFANQWGQYWHTTDAIFQYAFLLLFGATDNFKKNSYPYKFDSVANGGKWRWRQDDLDTIFDIDNQGLASKTYSILVGDKDNDGSIYSGDNSVFWTLVRETQEEEIKKMVRNIFDAMVAHPKAGSGSTMNKLVGCIRYCFWNFAQEYFPQSSYNHDAEWTYEDIWHAKAQFNPAVPPLKQALGGHYEAERDWVMMRLLFCASYFNYGAFTATGYDDATLGRMTYRGAGAHNYEITPAIDFNPTVLVGSSGTYSYRGRAKAGEKVTVSIPSTSGDNTNVYVMGLDWLSDVGDLSTLTMAGDASLQVVSKRLQRLKVGDEDASKIPITGTIKRIEELDCPSMTSVDARNVTTLAGEVDLTRLARLKEAYFGGTNVSLVKIADGSKIEKLELPASITTLKLKDLKFISREDTEYRLSWTNGVALLSGNNTASNSEYRYCDYVNIGGQKEIIVDGYFGSDNGLHFYRADKSVISFISASTLGLNSNTQSYGNVISVPKDAVYCRLCGRIDADLSIKGLLSSVIIESLANLATLQIENCPSIDSFDIMKEAYNLDGSLLSNIRIIGFDKNGDATDLSMLANMINDVDKDGNAHVYSGIDSQGNPTDNPVIEGRMVVDKPIYKDDETVLKEALGQGFQLESTGGYYVKFADPEVLRICAENWGDGVGTTEAQVEAVTTIGNKFYNNSLMATFDEFERFTGVTTVGTSSNSPGHGFNSCDNLESVKLPKSVTTVKYRAMASCPKLKSVGDLSNIKSLESGAFADDALEGEITLTSLEGVLMDSAFINNKITKVVIGDKTTGIGRIYGNSSTYGCFYNCAELEEVVLPAGIDTIGRYCFRDCVKLRKINIPSSIVSLGTLAFYNCTSLAIDDLNLPLLSTLESGVFGGAKITRISSLGSITSLPDSYYDSVFGERSSLVSVNLPEGLMSIGRKVFSGATNLVELNLPNSLTIISSRAFFKASAPMVLNAPNLTMLYEGAFAMSGLKRVENMGVVTSLPSAGYDDESPYSSFSVFTMCEELEYCKTPDSLETIQKVAFAGCKKCNFDLSRKIAIIESSAFRDCESFTNDIILPNLTTAAQACFWKAGIRRVLDLGSIPTLYGGNYWNDFGMFYQCPNLELIIAPESVTEVKAFSARDCSKLSTVIMLSATPPTLNVYEGKSAFHGSLITSGEGYIYVLDDSLEAYKTATNWGSYYGSVLRPISLLPSDNPDLYEEIKDYL